jgi:hypothetical protein
MNVWRAVLTGIDPPMGNDESQVFNLDWPPSEDAMLEAASSAFEMGYGLETWRPDKPRGAP